MTLSYLRRRVSYVAPALALAPLLMGADGQGCGPGAPFGNATEDGGNATTGASSGDMTSTGTTTNGSCVPADCKGDPPVLPCPSDAVSVSSCVAHGDGGCAWSAQCVIVGCSCPASLVTMCPDGQSPMTTTVSSGSCSCPVSYCPDAGSWELGTSDAAVVCGCPAVLVAKCPDGSLPPTMAGPAPCHCPVAGSCPAQDAATSDAAIVCMSDADCPTGSACGFPEAQACAVTQGECFSMPGVECQAVSLGCACDGTEVNIACNGLPSGYAPKPLRHTGSCTDGG